MRGFLVLGPEPATPTNRYVSTKCEHPGRLRAPQGAGLGSAWPVLTTLRVSPVSRYCLLEEVDRDGPARAWQLVLRDRTTSGAQYAHPADHPEIVNVDLARQRLGRDRLQAERLHHIDYALGSFVARGPSLFDISLDLI